MILLLMKLQYLKKKDILPRILAKHGLMKSVGEVKRNRKDLDITLGKLDFLEIKISKKKY